MLEIFRRGREKGDSEQSTWPLEEILVTHEYICKAGRAISEYYYQRLPILRQLPYLCLEADGRGGWDDGYSQAYTECILPIHKTEDSWGANDLFIELRTGMLVFGQKSESHAVITNLGSFHIGGKQYAEIATDVDIFMALADTKPQFNPEELMSELIARKEKQFHNNRETVDTWLQKKARLKANLDLMMAQVPEEIVLQTLRSQGFRV